MASQGPLSPGTVSNDATVGTQNWSSLNNAKTNNSSYALVSLGTITNHNQIKDNSIKLFVDGSVDGNDKSTGQSLPGSFTYQTFGGSSDTWGATLSSALVNQSNFGIGYSAKANSTFGKYLLTDNFGFSVAGGSAIDGVKVEIERVYGSSGSTGRALVDHVRVTVYYTVISISLNGNSTLTAIPVVNHNISKSLAGTSSASVYGKLVTDQSKVKKDYLYKVYDSSDNFLGVWPDVVSELNYTHEINTPGSSINVELGRNSDTRFPNLEELYTHNDENLTTQGGDNLIATFESPNNIGPGSDVDLNYRVEVWVFYGEVTNLITTSGEAILTQGGEEININDGAVNGLRKFNGYITRYISRYGGQESVLVSIASFGAELDNHVVHDGSDTTVQYSSQSPSVIATDILDTFNTDGGVVSYTASSVDSPGTTVTYEFRVNTVLEGLEIALKLAPFDWFYYVGLGDDTFYFKDRPTDPSLTIILGKHIEELELEYYMEDLTNLVYVTGGDTGGGSNLFKKYEDTTSQTTYRQGLKRITDHRVTVAASAELLADAEIDRFKDPVYRSRITLMENEDIDIEQIALGQLVAFRNFGNYVDDVTMQIMAIDYEPDRVHLQLDTLLPRVTKRIEDLRRNLIEADNIETPDAPT